MRLNKGIKYIFILCFCLLGNSLVKAQDDSLALPYPQMLFSNPGNFSQNIEYNLTSKDFTFNVSAISNASKPECTGSKTLMLNVVRHQTQFIPDPEPSNIPYLSTPFFTAHDVGFGV